MLMFTSLATIIGAASAVSSYNLFSIGGAGGYGQKAVSNDYVGALNHQGSSGYGVGLPAAYQGNSHAQLAELIKLAQTYQLAQLSKVAQSENLGTAPLPVQTAHHVRYHDVASSGHVNPVGVYVGPNVIPMHMLFRSASSLLNVKQSHQGAHGSEQETVSQDDPHYLRHSVQKPVIQEIREVVTPYRKIVQEIQPVREKIDTFVARSVGNHGQKELVGNVGALVEQNHGFAGQLIHPTYALSDHSSGTNGQGKISHHQIMGHHAFPIAAQNYVEQPIISKQIVSHQPIINKHIVTEQPIHAKQFILEQPIAHKQTIESNLAENYPVYSNKDYQSYGQYKK